MSTSENPEFEKMEQESKLVDLVREQRFLYDMSTSNYRNTPLREKTWKEIGDMLGMTVKECKSMWTRLRAQFRTFMHKLKNPSGSGNSKKPFFRHADGMMFLKDFLKDEETFSNCDRENQETEKEVVDVDGNEESQQEDETPVIVAVKGAQPLGTQNGNGVETPPVVKKETSPVVKMETPTCSKNVPRVNKRNEYRSHEKFNGKRKMDSFDQSLLGILESKDQEDTFGEMVAGKLRALRKADPKLASDTEFKINSVLHDAEMTM